jgi:2-oxo-3-hexenedioate decarboxylase
VTAESCAKALAEARADGRKLSEPPGPDPSGWEEAYAIQDALIAMSDSAVVGWKIGATSKIAQERLGVDGPFSGPVFARWFTESPAEVATPAHALRIVEPEFALTLAADLPARDVAYSADEIAAAVKSLHPAFELIDRRITDQPGGKGGGGFTGSAYWFPADAGANAALILGPGIDNWRDLDVPALGVSVTVDGAAKTQGVAANAMGGPLTSLAWLVEHLRDRGIGLKAGQVITTGVVTDIFDLQPGQSAEATFEALGSISLDMGEY